MPTNIDLIEMHLEEFIKEHPDQTWYTITGYIIGYYGEINLDHVQAVYNLWRVGKLADPPR